MKRRPSNPKPQRPKKTRKEKPKIKDLLHRKGTKPRRRKK